MFRALSWSQNFDIPFAEASSKKKFPLSTLTRN